MRRGIIEKIKRLAKEKNAVILAHNYQPPEIQDIADLCGDSLELSIRASKTDAEIILFCGVSFMAETAAIVSPDKTVLLPRADAGCPLADTVTPQALKAKIAENPAMPVVTYVNSTADVKAVSTICCTSANSVKVVNNLKENSVMMVPDKNLAAYTAGRTGKTIYPWNGYCPVHENLTPEAVLEQKQAHPEALFMAHPECRPEVLALADIVASTSGMLKAAKESASRSFIVGTEIGLIHPLKKQNPDKSFYPASPLMVCADMKKIRLEDVLCCLEEMTSEVRLPEAVRRAAHRAVYRMIEL